MNNPKDRQQWIYDALVQAPNTNYVEMFAKYTLEFAKSSKTFDKDWLKANESLKQYQYEVNKAKLKVSITEEVKALKIGIKSKMDRLMILQTEVENSLIDLESASTISEKVMLRKTIKELQSEISKIEGDYAATKTEDVTKKPPIFGDASL